MCRCVYPRSRAGRALHHALQAWPLVIWIVETKEFTAEVFANGGASCTVDVRYLPRSILPHPPPARPLLRARCFCDELVQSGPFADKEYLEAEKACRMRRSRDACTLLAKLNFAACELKKNATACVRYADMLRSGLGTEKDELKACQLYGGACDAGHQRGCWMHGMMLRTGDGCEQDLELSARQLARACSDGHPSACYHTGEGYMRGLGVKKDVRKAAALWEIACDRGHAPSCSNVGLMFKAGIGVKQDSVAALRFLKRACEKGTAAACVAAKSIDPEFEAPAATTGKLV